MIGHITGTLLDWDGASIVLDVGGLGYRIFVTKDILTKLPKQGALPYLALREMWAFLAPSPTVPRFLALTCVLA